MPNYSLQLLLSFSDGDIKTSIVQFYIKFKLTYTPMYKSSSYSDRILILVKKTLIPTCADYWIDSLSLSLSLSQSIILPSGRQFAKQTKKEKCFFSTEINDALYENFISYIHPLNPFPSMLHALMKMSQNEQFLFFLFAAYFCRKGFSLFPNGL